MVHSPLCVWSRVVGWLVSLFVLVFEGCAVEQWPPEELSSLVSALQVLGFKADSTMPGSFSLALGF